MNIKGFFNIIKQKRDVETLIGVSILVSVKSTLGSRSHRDMSSDVNRNGRRV